ncbi:alpha,alpha-trehalase nth1 [Perkinsus olseni]|uniref:Alpha,alpha-trehalase nth1 n=1 Tax=Perkinsus olseni TaxID=32597 RepID=A0A7J6NQM3_PEROL|nr:alpha,alpha-trehalase nth1 [Perkinsus olseni]
MVDRDRTTVDNLVKTLMTKLAAPGGVVSNDITDDHRGWVSLALETFINYGCLPEKFDVVSCTSTLNLEYGNQCTGVGDFFGWTTASVEFALQQVLTDGDIAEIERNMKMVVKND